MKRPELSYANVASTLALFFALAGGATAIAVSKKISTKQIKNQAVKTNKIANGAITADKLATGAVVSDKLAASAVTEPKIAAGAIGGTKLKAFVTRTANGTGFANALCESSERAISGGAFSQVPDPLRAADPAAAAPAPPTGWSGASLNAAGPVSVVAVCMPN